MLLTPNEKRIQKAERKLQGYRNELAANTGIYFSSDLTAAKQGFPLLKYIVNAMILFGATFGSINCIVTAFELKVTVQPMVLTCIVSALVLSFMYVSNKTKIITYLLILAGIISAAFRFFSVINSGVSALRNNILRYLDNHIDLPFLREYNLQYEDEFTAMSIALCLLAVALMILINIEVSERMSLRGVFICTFPIVQFGMYFNFNASKFSMLCVMVSWILVAGVSLTNSYNGLTMKMVSSSSVKKHRHSYGFITDSKNTAKIAAIWLFFIAALTGFVFAAVPGENFEVNLPTNAIKDRTERSVKNLLSYGLTSIYSIGRNASSPGQLANLSSISFDGRTDLEVTLVNYRAERMYFRNYAGYYYDSESMRWFPAYKNDKSAGMYNYTAEILAYDYEHGKNLTQSEHRVTVKTVDYDLMSYPLNVPYYSLLSNEDIYDYESSASVSLNTDSGANAYAAREYTFYTIDTEKNDYLPYINGIEDAKLKERLGSVFDEMKKEAHENAMTVPDVNLEAVEKFCETYRISAEDEDPVTEVVSALESDFEYTLRPGKVPYGEDYINYFLLGTQKGYCQHFASAATMIFRYLGIPARYCEGYALDYDDFYNAETLNDEDYKDWITTIYNSDRTVSRVEIPDSSGHAWVEIFKDGIGWIPVEATTAPSADDGPGLLANLFGGTNPLTSGSRRMMERVRNLNADATKRNITRMLAAALAAAVLIYIIRMLVIVIKRRRAFNDKNFAKALSSRYSALYGVWLHYLENPPEKELSYLEFFEVMTEVSGSGYDAGELCDMTEKILFSGENADAEEYGKTVTAFDEFRKAVVAKMTASKKFAYYFVKILW